MNERLLYYIWLSCALKPGSATPKLLLTHFDSVEQIYASQMPDYQSLGIKGAELHALCNKDLTLSRKHLSFCTANNIGLLCYEDPHYPERLKLIDNPPALFYYKGRIRNLDDYPCITMVGTRSCSERGFRLAYETAFDAASKGAVIVNGLALGIDGACIAASLDANGYSVGILGCGIDRIYPDGNRDLFKRLEACGLILSEFAPSTKPDAKNFPVRNRVISGLSLATVIFEADSKSGAMITAREAVIQGKRIFAVPAKPYDKPYSGPLELIKNGASVFTEANDVLSEYAMSFPHRLNLANVNPVPIGKLDVYVARFFKKGTDPDMPVSRRRAPVEGTRTQGNTSQAQYKQEGYSQKQSSIQKSEATPRDIVPEQNEQQKDEHKAAQAIHQVKQETVPQVKQETAHKDISVLSVPEQKIYRLFMEHESLTPDEISDFGMEVGDVLTSLTILEIYGYITALPGGRYKISD